MPTTYIRSYDGTHQVHVVTTLAQDRIIAPMLCVSSRPLRAGPNVYFDGPELPVIPCDDLDGWIAEQRAARDCAHAAYMAPILARLPRADDAQPMRRAA